MRSIVGLGLCVLGLAACTTEQAGSGEACTRSAQCAPGLACIAQVCSDDLDALREQSQVPMLGEEEPEQGEPGGAAGSRAVGDQDAG